MQQLNEIRAPFCVWKTEHWDIQGENQDLDKSEFEYG